MILWTARKPLSPASIMNDKRVASARIVGVEEHVNLPSLTGRLSEAAMAERGFLSRDQPFGRYSMLDKMNDTEGRLKDLDAVGVTVQVLSYPLPGAALLPQRTRTTRYHATSRPTLIAMRDSPTCHSPTRRRPRTNSNAR